MYFGLTYKGCVKNLPDDEKKKCLDKYGTNCKICFGNNCNSKNAFTRCLKCNSFSKPNCVSNHGFIPIQTCRDYDDECFVFTNGKTIERGCLKEKGSDFENGCKSNDAKCQICSNDDGRACNQQNLSIDTCIACNSNEDPRCHDDPSSINEIICSVNAKTAGCYLHRYEDVCKRGCVSDLSESFQGICLNQSDKCKTCIGKNCNVVKDYKTCYTCDSKNDSYCVKVSELTNVTICSNYLSSCATLIENGYTNRKCYDDFDSNNESTIDLCTDDKCNSNVFPKNRLQCYQCSGDEECKHITEESILEPCKFYSENDQCYSLINEGRI